LVVFVPVLIAQLVAPPTQQGPIRLPAATPQNERPAAPSTTPKLDIEPPSPPLKTPLPQTPPQSSAPRPRNQRPVLPYPIEGRTPYSDEQLEALLRGCPDPDACAERLRQRLAADGYLNTLVVAQRSPDGVRVVLGRLEKLRAEGPSPWLNRRVQRLLSVLESQPLRLPEIQRQLRLLQRQPGIRSVQGSLTSIDNDPYRAQLVLRIEPGPQPLQGDFSLRNDGTNGSGEFRATGVLLKNALALPGDSLLLYGELDSTDTPELGAVIGSISYTLPLADTLGLTGSFGYNRQTPVELESPGDLFTTRQYQGQLQLEWTFHETLLQRWSFTTAISANENQLTFDGESLPSFYPSVLRNPRTGFLRVGVNGNGLAGPVGWFGTGYVLQGVAGMTPEDQRNDLASLGIAPGEATAFGALASANWLIAPTWQLNMRAGGQIALHPLTSAMKFSLGSDVGIRGLPGQLVSGDSGWLTTGELVWTFWQKDRQALQLIPFIGAGGVYTSLNAGQFNDVVGSGGLLARWLAGEHLSLELGYAQSFNTDNNEGAWDNWLLGSGLYAKASYRF